MTKKTDLEKLKKHLGIIADLDAAVALLDWDIHTGMAPGSMASREFQLATLETLSHREKTSAVLGGLLDRLWKEYPSMNPASDDACLIRIAYRDFQKNTKTPSDWVERNAKTSAKANISWLQARKKNDFRIFAPSLEEILSLKMEYSSFFAPYHHPYDPLLDLFDEGLTCDQIERTFRILEEEQKPLIRSAAAKEWNSDDAFLRTGRFPASKQMALTRKICTAMGYDWKCGRQDRSPHPFTTTIGLSDVRITTKIIKGNPFSSFFSSVHECGHALYEQGICKTFDRTPLGTGTSYSVHESQSRLWENLVVRSPEFWDFFYPVVQKLYPESLSGIDKPRFLRGINRVEPSSIRTEADELTYNMHIILRFRLEKELLEGKLSVSDLPGRWNDEMKDLLGISISSDCDGVLQDVHWSMGEFGYFPSYAMGNILAAQFFEAAVLAIPEIPLEIARGNLMPLRDWLKENIHVHGAKYTTGELLRRITGNATPDPRPCLNQLKKKYGGL